MHWRRMASPAEVTVKPSGVRLSNVTPRRFSKSAMRRVKPTSPSLRQMRSGADGRANLTARSASRRAMSSGWPSSRHRCDQSRCVWPRYSGLRQAHPGLQVDLVVGVRSSKRYLTRAGIPKRGQGLAGHDLITFTGAPAATSPFFLGESLDGARIALRCDNPLIQRTAAANDVGIAELACFLGDCFPDVIRVWPHEAPARRTVWLILHEDMRRSARIRAVSATITEAFRHQRNTLAEGIRSKSGSH